MKKITFIAVLILLMGVMFSCEKEDPIPYCEEHNVGTVEVKNSTGYNIWTDVTWGDVIVNYETRVSNGGSYTYNDIPAGRIEIWISFNGSDWYFEYESLSACEEMTFTWYLDTGARKSAGSPFVLDIGDGNLVSPTLKDKN